MDKKDVRIILCKLYSGGGKIQAYSIMFTTIILGVLC